MGREAGGLVRDANTASYRSIHIFTFSHCILKIIYLYGHGARGPWLQSLMMGPIHHPSRTGVMLPVGAQESLLAMGHTDCAMHPVVPNAHICPTTKKRQNRYQNTDRLSKVMNGNYFFN